MAIQIKSNRLEAFSDGVLAIIITIMVLEFQVPKTAELKSLIPLLPVFISYILSFINLAIYWNNHHHLFSAVEAINGKVMWANMNLLFWLSLLPFATAWMGENKFTKWPVFVYGIVLLGCGVAYFILTKILINIHERDSALVIAIAKNKREQLTIFIYLFGVGSSLFYPYLALGIYFAVTFLWIIPDKRIEKEMEQHIEEEAENEKPK
jgi:uncharacterized membrane protein